MSEPLLQLLKFSLLAVLYLFLFRVVRAVWAEITPPATSDGKSGGKSRGRRRGGPPPSSPPSSPSAAPSTPGPAPLAPARGRRGRDAPPSQLVALEPAGLAGTVWAVPDETTLGRAAGCGIPVDDTFVSQLHARLFRVDGTLHIEDLGSTNGTFVNDERVGGPRPLRRGDRLKVGNAVLELR